MSLKKFFLFYIIVMTGIIFVSCSNYSLYKNKTPTQAPLNDIEQNETISASSPNGLYLIEMYGTNSNVTAAGLIPYEATRLIQTKDNSIIWKEDFGYYSAEFLWSEDSRFVAVNGTTRTNIVSYIVDVRNGTVIDLPSYSELSSHYNNLSQLDNVLYIDYQVRKWIDDNTVRIEFEDQEDEMISGIFNFNLENEEINYIK